MRKPLRLVMIDTEPGDDRIALADLCTGPVTIRCRILD
jgi:hypothetical protein